MRHAAVLLVLLAVYLGAARAGVRSNAPMPAPPADVASSAQTLRVGILTLQRCSTPAPWCGWLERPLDPTGRLPDRIQIYFEFYPHTTPGRVQSTLVATEGGPGFPATQSRQEYLALFAPLRATRDVLLMDNRGTGRSAPIDCRPLQTDPAITEENVGACGAQLGERAALYSDAMATDDLAALLDALQLGPIDLYGDSSGTFFAQMFAGRHAGLVRSLVLDGAYPLNAPDYAWYPNYAPAMRAKFNLACERSAACRGTPGSALSRLERVLEILRDNPFEATAAAADGQSVHFEANATQLAIVMFGSAPAYASVRELDAAGRAFVEGDRLPLLRLMAETQVSVDSRDATRSPAQFSAGLAAVVMCHDAPQIYDMSEPVALRVTHRDGLIAQRERLQPQSYAPFTFAEYRRMPLDYAFLDECVRWPPVSPADSGTPQDVQHMPAPDVPTLVISGDLDNMTPVADGALATAKFRRGVQVIVPNGLHVNALPHARSGCPAELARRFIATGQTGDTRCLQEIPEIRLFPRFARRFDELPPATASAGNSANEMQLRAASAAVLTIADIIDRLGTNTSGRGVGLRGGAFSVARPEPQAGVTMMAEDASYHITLHEVRWTEDLRVSGEVDWPGRSGPGRAELQLRGPPQASGSLQIRWSEGVVQAEARITGQLGGATVAAAAAAP